MELYFSPLACSMATRITLYEAGEKCDYRQVDLKAKTVGGEDFLATNPLGQVPVLRTDDGVLITENTAVLQYVARRHPRANLAPTEEPAVSEMQQWLSFLSTELHTAVFAPLFNPAASDAVKAYALEKARPRLALLNQRLKWRDTVLEHFSIVDAYLVTILTWLQATPLRLDEWSDARRYYDKISKRPSVARALAEEYPLYRA
jgi:glutathione S-transferase